MSILNAHADGCTYTGQPIVFSEPSHTKILWADLGIHLSREQRYQNARAFSVLDHSVLVTWMARRRQVGPRLLGYFALHDASEYVLKDLHPAVKRLLPKYGELEAAWLEHIHRSLGLMWPLPAALKQLVKYFDKRGLVTEMTMLGDPRADVAEGLWGHAAESDVVLAATIQAMPVDEKTEFLRWAADSSRQAGNDIGEVLNHAQVALSDELEVFSGSLARMSA